jgi:hypothetical protein
MFWGVVTQTALALLVIVKMHTVLETRSQDMQYRNNTKRIQELTEDLDISRRKYLITVKSEGVSKHKLSQLKTRWATLKQNLEQIEITSAQRENRREKELELTLEKVVMEALGGPTARRDSHFKRVMKAITQLIDLDKQNNNENLILTVQEKLAEMAQDGSLDASPLAQAKQSSEET